MTDLGIPIPRVKPNAIFFAGCGETGTHADTCPSRSSPMAPATVAEVAILRGMIETCIEHGQVVNERIANLVGHGQSVDKETDMLRSVANKLCSRLDALEDRLHRAINYSSQQDRNAAECVGALENRILALEAKRKK